MQSHVDWEIIEAYKCFNELVCSWRIGKMLSLFFTLQNRGKGTKHKKKCRGSTGGSLSDSSGSVIRQVGATLHLPSALSQNFISTQFNFFCVNIVASGRAHTLLSPISCSSKELPPNEISERS
jgi:hypothetical protein